MHRVLLWTALLGFTVLAQLPNLEAHVSPNGPQPSNGLAVLHYVRKKEKSYVLLGPTSSGATLPISGAKLILKRVGHPASAGLDIPTGSVRVISHEGQQLIAEVDQEESELSRQMFPKFPGIMAGDRAFPAEQSIEANMSLLPTLDILYRDLFTDPGDLATTYELSDAGKSLLSQHTKAIAVSHTGTVLVEGFTDRTGNRQKNQVESYQRALTVRQFLIDQLGFLPDRILAIGQGEGELVDTSETDDFRQQNRRIIIKVIDHSMSTKIGR